MSTVKPVNIDALARSNTYPSIKFEQASGMKELSRVYKMPCEMDMEEAWKYFLYLAWSGKTTEDFKKGKGRQDVVNNPAIREFVQEIIDLNPELETVRFDAEDNKETNHFIYGVFSRFLPEDIDFMINRMNREWDSRMMLLNIKTGINITGWRPSEKTAEKIKAHFGFPEWEPTQEEIENAENLYFRHFYNRNISPAPQAPAPTGPA
jgi:hypothetical protein